MMEDEKVAKILADKINERFRIVVDDLRNKISFLERKIAYLETESVEKFGNVIKAVFDASVSINTKKVSHEIFADLKSEFENFRKETKAIQENIKMLEERYRSLTAVFESGLDKFMQSIGNTFNEFSLEINKISTVVKEEVERHITEIFDISISKEIRDIVTNTVAQCFEKLQKELNEKLVIIDDIQIQVRQLTEAVQAITKELNELKQTTTKLKVTPFGFGDQGKGEEDEEIEIDKMLGKGR